MKRLAVVLFYATLVACHPVHPHEHIDPDSGENLGLPPTAADVCAAADEQDLLHGGQGLAHLLKAGSSYAVAVRSAGQGTTMDVRFEIHEGNGDWQPIVGMEIRDPGPEGEAWDSGKLERDLWVRAVVLPSGPAPGAAQVCFAVMPS